MPHGPHPTLQELRDVVAAASGRRPGSLLLTGGTLVDVFTGRMERADVLVMGSLVAAVGDLRGAAADAVVAVEGHHLVPGLVDGHVHVESSLVTAAEYARAVLPRGVTGAVCDPHEIANVAGMAGVRWLLDGARELPFDVWVTVPSCVPSTRLETAGATLGLTEVRELLDDPWVVGMAEVMSFPDVIGGDEATLEKVRAGESVRKTVEGHAPGLSGRDLHAYLSAGIGSDHESTTFQEALEKLAAGAFVMVREGSVSRDLEALMPLVEPRYADRVGFVTDDRLPHDLLHEGGVDVLVRRAIAHGADPVYAVRCASWNTALHYRLPRRGAIAPGYVADIVVVDDLAGFSAAAVYKSGRLVAEAGRVVARVPRPGPDGGQLRGSVRLPTLTANELALPAPAPGRDVRVIRPVPGQIVTREERVAPTLRDGAVVADPERDLAKLVCVERHGASGRVGVGLVTGFGLRRGALASTVGHDHHNLMLVGVDDDDLIAAARRAEALGGGLVVVDAGEVVAEVPLPLAGLLSDGPLERVQHELELVEAAAGRLGVREPGAFMTLSFLGLAVIPELRLTDHGLVDVRAATVVPLEAPAP